MGLQQFLAREGYDVATADSVDKGFSYIDDGIDVVITHLGKDFAGMQLVRHWKLRSPDTMILVVSGHTAVQAIVEAVRGGATTTFPNRPIH